MYCRGSWAVHSVYTAARGRGRANTSHNEYEYKPCVGATRHDRDRDAHGAAGRSRLSAGEKVTQTGVAVGTKLKSQNKPDLSTMSDKSKIC